MKMLISIAAAAVLLSGCLGPKMCDTGTTVAYEDPADGVVKFRQLTRPCSFTNPGSIGPASNSSGIFSDAHMEAPAPGQAWWD